MTKLWKSPDRTASIFLTADDICQCDSGSGIQDPGREELFPYGATAEELSSSGPFYAAEWTRGSKIVLKKNPNYWDAANVKLETVNMVLAQDENTESRCLIRASSIS